MQSKKLTYSVVVPVYRGAQTLELLVSEILQVADFYVDNRHFQLREVVLVDDGSIDESALIIKQLVQLDDRVKGLWLARNYGQHAATIAGIASTNSTWIVTLDEDGQFRPDSIPALFERAVKGNHQLVYGHSSHTSDGAFRKLASGLTKKSIVKWLTSGDLQNFSSFRLIDGFSARAVSAYVGNNTYLDVALSWVVKSIGQCDVVGSTHGGRPSTYNFRKLADHWIRLLTSTGTRPLRLMTIIGFIVSLMGIVGAIAIVIGGISRGYPVAGWASLSAIVLILGGLVLFSLGVLSEYVGVLVRILLGRPLYLVSDHVDGRDDAKH